MNSAWLRCGASLHAVHADKAVLGQKWHAGFIHSVTLQVVGAHWGVIGAEERAKCWRHGLVKESLGGQVNSSESQAATKG